MENFVVSARKYRPATFSSVVGQHHITSTLKNAISRNQLAHAYLFCGPRGVGKTTCARIFAKAINCLSPVDSEACGQCESCRAFNEGRSFNIYELDAASNNSVDDIRTLTEQVRIPPQIGRYSVYIIDEVHMLSLAAFNAFLKTLEEPPAHAVFILATTEKHKIIPTILSRCQIFDFNRIKVEDSVAYLRQIAANEGVTADDESLNLIAQKADGGMRDALSMFDKVVSFCGSNLAFKEVAQTLNVLDYETYFNVVRCMLAGDYPAALLLLDEVLRQGFSMQNFLAGLNGHMRDLLMCKNPQTAGLLEVTGSLAERYRAQAAECPVPLLFESVSLLTTLDQSLRTATNQRLNVELGLMKLCGLGQKKNNDNLGIPLPPLPGDAGWQTGGPAAEATPTPGSTSAPTPGNTVTPAPTATPGNTGCVMPGTGHTLSFENRPAAQPAVMPGNHAAKGAPDGRMPGRTANPPGGTVAGTGAAQPLTGTPARTAESPENGGTATAGPTGSPGSATNVAAHAEMSGAAPVTPGTGGPVRGARPAVSISGTSILSILNGNAAAAAAEEEETGPAAVSGIDPEAESKMARSREAFLRAMQQQRPRLAMAFHDMEIRGNAIAINVPNESLHDEIMRTRTEILGLMTEVAGVCGEIGLDIRVVADTGPRKPIKVEDRLRFLVEKNPELINLKKELDLDIE